MTISLAAPNEPGLTRARIGTTGVVLLAAMVYAIVVGGTSSGELDPVLRVINAVAGSALIGVFVVRAPARADGLDRLLLIALLLFVLAGIGSRFPRQTFDAVLAATTYLAVLFVAREQLAWPSLRRALILTLRTMAAVFAGGAAIVWLGRVIEWWSLTGKSALPPLDLQLSAGPWGHRYDLALLVVLLYPAWWVGSPSRAQRLGAVLIGLLTLVVVTITGSRTTWLAVAGATLIVCIPPVRRAWSSSTHGRGWLTGGLAAISLGVLAVLAFTPVGDRLSNLASLDWRFAMWGPLTELWLQHPLTGIGAGGFPWALQMTDYFDTRTWAPRHPDSAVMQGLPEVGLLGAAAMIVVLFAVLHAVFSGRSLAAKWGVTAFAIACVGANPSDFAYLVVVAAVWVAFAAPHETDDRPHAARRRSGPVLTASAAAGAVIAAAYLATAVAAFAHEGGRHAVADDELAAAREAFGLAATLDPGMALYHRQLGVAELALDAPRHAVIDLERATALNPSDDLAWRALAIAHERSGDVAAAGDALNAALDAQRSDPTNLLLGVRHLLRAGEEDAGVALLAEVIQSWPAAVGAPMWDAVIESPEQLRAGLDAAAERWISGASTPELPVDQGLWLGVLSNRPELLEAAIGGSAIGPDLGGVLALQLTCDPAASAELDGLGASRVRNVTYWELRTRESGLNGEIDIAALSVLAIMTGTGVTPELASVAANAVNENVALSHDRWGYRRNPVDWPDIGTLLPSVDAGTAAWMVTPRAAVDASGFEDRVPEC